MVIAKIDKYQQRYTLKLTQQKLKENELKYDTENYFSVQI